MKRRHAQPDRRAFLAAGAAIGGASLFAPLLPAWAKNGTPGVTKGEMPTLSGDDIHLTIDRAMFTVAGKQSHAVTVNGGLPSPLLRLREGDTFRVAVTNALTDEDASIHWHGVILPFHMDGVPGLSFPGIAPGDTFVYEFPIVHAGTFWYHSHSGMHEALGQYGPLIFDPAGRDPVEYDREHIIVLSDWSAMHPHTQLAKLKKMEGYFNYQRHTLAGWLRGEDSAQTMPLAERLMWSRMRMDPTDIADVTGAAYTYLVNGHEPADNWTALFTPGERVRLRFINASSMTIFNVRIPGLELSVVQADGNDVVPTSVDEFVIAVAETYDVVVTPNEERAYTIVAETTDRSGMARATLAPRPGMSAEVPPLRPRPTLGMSAMGMGEMDHGAMSGMDHGAMDHSTMDHSAMTHDTASGVDHAAMDHGGMEAGATDHSTMDHSAMAGMDHSAMDHGAMDHGAMNMRDPSGLPPHVAVGVGVDMIAPMPADAMGRPGLGLEQVGHKVLVYADLKALAPNPDTRPPERELEIHLTGNMERFMWSFNGRPFSAHAEPIRLARDERVRLTFINNTMMQHPIHLHGHFFELANDHAGYRPRKHTVNVLPGSRLSVDLTADNPGDWAFHCHLNLHMHAGMFSVVTVRPLDGAPA
ncbi:MAG TPA: copper resistance system multicopper oxidase [Hyphomicrobiales bacterium]|nr:copper resistance system multicopper oxidase [Hyphomicrobiales bacterium]